MNFSNYPILKTLIPYIFGILSGYYAIFPSINPIFLLFTLIATVPFLAFFQKKLSYKRQKMGGVLLQFCFVLFGFASIQLRFSSNTEDILQENHYWIVTLVDHPQEKERTVKCVGKVEGSTNGKSVKQKSVFYFQKSERSQLLQMGDVLALKTQFVPIEPPANPFSFNYQRYMLRRGIAHTAYVPSHQWELLEHSFKKPVKQLSGKLQRFFALQFTKNGLQGDEYSIITAILLGNDDTMDPSLRRSYTSTGVSHILCVSGMHVGIIYMILSFLLKPLTFHRKGRIMNALILLLAIWSYAHITGLAPSVQRAATMFTFVTFGTMLHRNCNVFHSISASLLILLFINPFLIFEMGFQLSYLAVLGIVWLQKSFCSIWKPKSKIVSYFWELGTVSLAAQIATGPIAVYHFGQFPNYFLPSNLFVIMLSFVIVATGVALLAFSFSHFIASIIGKLLYFEIKGMNSIVFFIEQLPGAVTTYISLSVLQVFLIYGMVIVIFLLVKYRKKRYYWVMWVLILLFVLISTYRTVHSRNESSVTVYQIPKKMAVNFNYHGKSILLHNFIEDKKDKDYQFSIYNHERNRKIESRLLSVSEELYAPECAFYKKGDYILFENKMYKIDRKKGQLIRIESVN